MLRPTLGQKFASRGCGGHHRLVPLCKALSLFTGIVKETRSIPLSHRARGTRSFSTTTKPRIAILGSGWSGFRLAQDLDKTMYDVTVISPRNHFLFTPLLPSTAVGTLEFRCIQEPIRTIPGLNYIQASCNNIDFEKKILSCTEIFKGRVFDTKFDYLVMAVGSETNTFGVPGVENNPNVFFLKQLEHARAIRNRLIECFERASIRDLDEAEKKRLLTFVVVGGGAINIEFASELYDFLTEDVSKWYPDLKNYIRVVVVEASGHILGTFKESLVNYVEKLFISRNIELRTQTTVKEVKYNVAHLGNGDTLPFGVMVWSTGVKQVALIRNLPSLVCKTQGGRVKIDQHLRVVTEQKLEGGESSLVPICDGTVFAIGDCAADSLRPLPSLAQVAGQQGIYLSKLFNRHLAKRSPETLSLISPPQSSTSPSSSPTIAPFQYSHFASIASVGKWKGVYDSTNIAAVQPHDQQASTSVSGFLAFVLWRSAYWTKQVQITGAIDRKRLRFILVNWKMEYLSSIKS